MLFEPITSYDAKRGRKASSRRQVVPREHMVYFARMGESRIIKIGRTSNIQNRSGGHILESGMTPRYLVQLIVATREEAKELERHVLAFAKSRFPRDNARYEWFQMADHDVSEVLFNLKDTSPVEILEQRGDPALQDETPSMMEEARHETTSAARSYHSMRRARIGGRF